MSVSRALACRPPNVGRLWAIITLVAALAVGCKAAETPSTTPSESPEPSASAVLASSPPSGLASSTPESAPAWRADVVPSTEAWAAIVVVLDLVDGTDDTTARAMREAVVDLMVNATDGTEIGVVRASHTAETLVAPVSMGTGRREAIDQLWSAPATGKRDLGAALRRAAMHVARSEAASYRRGILVIAAGTDDSVHVSAFDDVPRDVHVVTYGNNVDETAYASFAQRSGGRYGHADDEVDLRRRVADVRREVEEMSLVATGVLEADRTGQASTPVGIGSGQIFARFSAFGVAHDALEVTNADGEVFTATEDADVRVTEFGERVSLGIGAASSGTWRLALRGVPAGQSVPFEVETFFSSFPDARGEADLDAAEGLAIGYMDGGLPVPAQVTATLHAPDGAERTVALEVAPDGEAMVCCIGNMLQTHVPGPFDGGPYVITVRSNGGSGSTAYERAVTFGFYMWPAVDTDGDAIRDRIELSNGMDPRDPTDGEFDADTDGLTMSRELGELDTDPFDYDTDDGGEGDGAEVTAKRDPLDRDDDQVAASCAPDQDGDSDRFNPRENAPRAPDLEALLPDRLLGQTLVKFSITGTPLLHPAWPGVLLEALVQCTEGFPPTLEVAYAGASSWASIGIIAIRIERSEGGVLRPVPAKELADAFLHRMLPGRDYGPRPFEVDGRRAILLESGSLVYASDDVLFMTMGLSMGDCFQDCGSPPDMEDLATALLKRLPIPED
jgi:hypothetical protein